MKTDKKQGAGCRKIQAGKEKHLQKNYGKTTCHDYGNPLIKTGKGEKSSYPKGA